MGVCLSLRSLDARCMHKVPTQLPAADEKKKTKKFVVSGIMKPVNAVVEGRHRFRRAAGTADMMIYHRTRHRKRINKRMGITSGVGRWKIVSVSGVRSCGVTRCFWMAKSSNYVYFATRNSDPIASRFCSIGISPISGCWGYRPAHVLHRRRVSPLQYAEADTPGTR